MCSENVGQSCRWSLEECDWCCRLSCSGTAAYFPTTAQASLAHGRHIEGPRLSRAKNKIYIYFVQTLVLLPQWTLVEELSLCVPFLQMHGIIGSGWSIWSLKVPGKLIEECNYRYIRRLEEKCPSITTKTWNDNPTRSVLSHLSLALLEKLICECLRWPFTTFCANA